MSGVSGGGRVPVPSVERVLELTDLQIDALLAVGPPALLYDVMEGDRGIVSNLIADLPPAVQRVMILEATRCSQRLTIVQLRCHTEMGPFDIRTTWDARGGGRPWVIAFEFTAVAAPLVSAIPTAASALAAVTWRRKRRRHQPSFRPAAATPVGRRGSAASAHRRTTAGAAR